MRQSILLLSLLLGLLATPVLAQPAGFSGAIADTGFQTFTTEAAPSRLLTVAEDKSTAFRLAGAAGKIVVAQPDIAEIVANTDRSLYIRGKALGATNILVYDQSRRLIEVIDVKVGHDLDGIQAAILSVKLPHLQKWTEGRRRVASVYDRMFAQVPGVTIPRVAKDRTHVYHLYVIR
ncbi:MAG: hypothetical protein EBS42_06770, partial [Caulobacteraceae bacterium]|nr:hypothetical protein [Caulobacteraceae bacterium]